MYYKIKKSDCSFKYYIYLIAKSKAISYINTEKRRAEINEQYFSKEGETIGNVADELNKQTFTTKELSENSYYKIHGGSTFELKNKIEKGIKQKFNEDSKVLDKVEWGNPDSYTLYAMLKKKFNYLERFPILKDNNFGNSEEKVKYFGLEPDTMQDASKNVEVLFYNSKEDFGVKLKTKEKEEDKQKPYFALKVDNTDVLVSSETNEN